MSQTTDAAIEWPITFDDVRAARDRIAPYVQPTPLRAYPQLSELAGGGMQVFVKHENHQPTNAFKIRNGLSFMTALDADERRRGVVAASTGNHGQGIALGGSLLGVSDEICVPAGNNPEKNAAMRALGATVVEEGRDYDEAVVVMQRLACANGHGGRALDERSAHHRRRGHDDAEILEQEPELDAIVIAVGGGSQAVGALTVARALAPGVEVYGVQAAGAPAIHDSWHAGSGSRRRARHVRRRPRDARDVRSHVPGAARGTRRVRDGDRCGDRRGLRTILSMTHNLVEGAGAMGFAALAQAARTARGQERRDRVLRRQHRQRQLAAILRRRARDRAWMRVLRCLVAATLTSI